MTHVTLLLASLQTWSFCTQTWCRALCSAAMCHCAASCQTGVRPQSSALCRASLWSKNAGGHVWAAHPLWWSGNNPTSRSERLRPWAGLPVPSLLSALYHHSSWAWAWASLPSLWKWLWCDRPHRWRAHRDSCWLQIFWPAQWTPLHCTFCSHKGWPGGALVPRAFCWSRGSCAATTEDTVYEQTLHNTTKHNIQGCRWL